MINFKDVDAIENKELFSGWGDIIKELAIFCKSNNEHIMEQVTIIKELSTQIAVLNTRLSALERAVEHLEKDK